MNIMAIGFFPSTKLHLEALKSTKWCDVFYLEPNKLVGARAGSVKDLIGLKIDYAKYDVALIFQDGLETAQKYFNEQCLINNVRIIANQHGFNKSIKQIVTNTPNEYSLLWNCMGKYFLDRFKSVLDQDPYRKGWVSIGSLAHDYLYKNYTWNALNNNGKALVIHEPDLKLCEGDPFPHDSEGNTNFIVSSLNKLGIESDFKPHPNWANFIGSEGARLDKPVGTNIVDIKAEDVVNYAIVLGSRSTMLLDACVMGVPTLALESNSDWEDDSYPPVEEGKFGLIPTYTKMQFLDALKVHYNSTPNYDIKKLKYYVGDLGGISDLYYKFINNLDQTLFVARESSKSNTNSVNNRYCIKESYVHRKKYVHFDDTQQEDAWQLEVYLHALGLMKKHKLTSVADLGCGSGYKLVTYLGEYNTIGLELNVNLDVLKKKYPQRTWLESNFEINHNIRVDILICSDVIEHIVNPDELIDYINKIDFKYLILSTPERDLVYEENSEFHKGPPRNLTHQREWSFSEFNEYIGKYFDIIDHRITNYHQATQTMLCKKKIPIVNLLVSVIVPTYNRKKLLYRTLQSIKEQTYKNIEIIIINDAGTDVKDLISSLSLDNYKYIQHKKNKGLAATRNSGLKIAKGDYIAYLDDDDVYLENHIEDLVTYSQENNYDVVYSNSYRVTYNNEDKFNTPGQRIPFYKSNFDCGKLLISNLFPVLSVIHSSKCIEKIGLFDESLPDHEDWDFWIRMSKYFKFNHLDKYTSEVTWVQDGTTMTSASNRNYTATYIKLYNRYTLSPNIDYNILEQRHRHLLALASFEKRQININEVLVDKPDAVALATDLHTMVGSHQNDVAPPSNLPSKKAKTDVVGESMVAEPVRVLRQNTENYQQNSLINPAQYICGIEGEPPLVSIVLTTYNRPDFLRRSILSVLSQTHENLELIVVNDCGEDVEHIIRDMDRTGRIHYLRLNANYGLAGARNFGLKIARGKYLGFLDDDDFLDSHHLKTLVEVLEKGDYQVAYANSRRIFEVEEKGQLVTERIEDPVESWCQPFCADRLLVDNLMPVQSVLFHCKCPLKIGYFDETLPVLEDWEFWLRLSRKFEFKHVEITTSTVTSRNDNMTVTQRLDFSNTYPRIIKRYQGYAEDRPDIHRGQEQMLKCLAPHPNMRAMVSIVIHAVNDTERDKLERCLFAIRNRTRGVMYEIIVAGVGEPLRIEDGPSINWVSLTEGQKSSSAINAAVAQATGVYLAIVDPFVSVRIGWIRPLLAYAKDDANVSAVGGQTLGADGQIAHAAVKVSRRSSTRQLFIGDETHDERLADIEGVSALAGGVVLFRAADFHKQGGVIANASAREAIGELCLRLVATGGHLAIAPRSVCYLHKPRHDTRDLDLLERFRSERRKHGFEQETPEQKMKGTTVGAGF